MLANLYGLSLAVNIAVVLHLHFRYQLEDDMNLLDACSFLDPRTKSLPYLSDSEKAKIQDQVFSMLLESTAGDSATESHTEPSTQFVDSEPSTSASTRNLLDDMFPVDVAPATVNIDQVLNDELKAYVNEPRCPMADSPLLW